MIAIDTNILVYAHRRDSAWHAPARARVDELAASGRRWAIPWPCVHEFIGVVTGARAFRDPTPLPVAFDQVRAWMESPSLSFLAEEPGHLDVLEALAKPARISGAAIHDARVMAICVQHKIEMLWTADRDFSRFRGVPVVNPLIGDRP